MKRCLSLTGDGKSFPRRLYLWREQSKVSTKQDTIFPHSHAQPGNSGETEYLSLVQQLWVVQMGWRREETICLLITRRFMLLLRPALTVASFCSKAPLTYFKQSQWAERPSLTLLTWTRLPLLCPCSYEWSGSFPQVSQHGSLTQPLSVTPGEGCAPHRVINHLSPCPMQQDLTGAVNSLSLCTHSQSHPGGRSSYPGLLCSTVWLQHPPHTRTIKWRIGLGKELFYCLYQGQITLVERT